MSQSNDLLEKVAVGVTIRNRVVAYNSTYSEMIEESYAILSEIEALLQRYPAINDPMLIEPGVGLLSIAARIVNFEQVDITANPQTRGGAMFFARVTTVPPDSNFARSILACPDRYPLLGTWGASQFFGAL